MAAKKQPTATPKKLGRPFQKGPDPRRCVTSPGRPPDEFRAMMRELASRQAVVDKLAEILKDPNHPHFMRAYAEAADRGYGKASQPIEHSGEMTHRVKPVPLKARIAEIRALMPKSL